MASGVPTQRPVRKDYLTGQAARCSYRDKVYDGEATTKLNDPAVQKAFGGRVRSCMGHNDHFHVELQGNFAS